MRIELTRSLKIRLLQSLKDGVLETDSFPELYDEKELKGSIPIEDWIKWRIKANTKNDEATINART